MHFDQPLQLETLGTSELFERLHSELYDLASTQCWKRDGQAWSAAGLIAEAFIRLAQHPRRLWDSSEHFLRVAACAMRSVLIDDARKRATFRRGGHLQRVTLGDGSLSITLDADRFLDLEEALRQLALVDPVRAEIVQLKFFAGLGVREVARAMHLDPSTVQRKWCLARAWLYRRLETGRG